MNCSPQLLKILILVILIPPFCVKSSFAQAINKSLISSKKATDEILVDGNLKEESWQNAEISQNFWNLLDTGHAKLNTQVKVSYDDKNLYIGVICFTPSKPFVQTLKRDTDPWDNEGFFVVLDPMNEKRSGYIFGVNANGAQSEGIIEVNDMSLDWNTKWYAETKHFTGYYTIEISIPFSSVRFNLSNKSWGINFIRSDMHTNQYSNWAHVPLQWNGFNLNFAGQLNFETVRQKVSSAKNIIQPYLASLLVKDYSIAENKAKYNAGIDAKLAITPSLNLDLTANPDFSQIEVDQQIINLNRFNVQFPERRTFFLENNDLFTSFGLPGIRPFLSRQIGLTADGRQKPIIGGARLTGNLSSTLRVGIMDMQLNRFENENQQNYFVGVFEQKIFRQSSIKGIFTNRNALGNNTIQDNNRFNRAAGLEFNYLSEKSTHRASAKMHYTFSDFSSSKSQFAVLSYGYVKNKISTNFILSNLGENYNPEMGFAPYNIYYDRVAEVIRRKGYTQIQNTTTKLFRPGGDKISNIALNMETYYSRFSDHTFLEARNQFTASMDFFSTSKIQISTNQYSARLPYQVEIAGALIDPGKYWFSVYQASYSTDRRKQISVNVFGEVGDYYGGYRYTYGGSLAFKKLPFVNINLGANINNIIINQKKLDLLLIHAKTELNLSKNVFWTNFLQYNTQSRNFNINSRFQWRFKPMSDLYLVYTDNYDTAGFLPQNKSISLKLNYWINL